MNTMKAFIVEDEKHNRDYLISLLNEHFKEQIELVGSAGSVLESVEFLNKFEVDLLFLDIELSDSRVFDLLDRIQHRNYRLIFITGYSEHAIKAIKYAAVDYLLKPIITEEFIEAVNKVLQSPQYSDRQTLEYVLDSKNLESNDYLIVNNRHSIDKIFFEKISHLEADGIYTNIYHENKKTVSSKPLGAFEEVLPLHLFNRCHKSYIVNKFFIKRVEKGRNMEITLHSGGVVPVSVRKKEEFSRWLKGD